MDENPSTRAARALVDALIFHGVRQVVLSPGSRSAPLAYALARAEGKIRTHVRIDERVAAFTALGLAKFAPAAVVTTSGTAAANLHPALLEARHSHTGLLAITADRPHELRGVGASQTTDQMHMYGPYIHAVELPAGVDGLSVAGQVSRIATRLHGAYGPAEPVHLNIAFRDPLVPQEPLGGEVGQERGTRFAPRERVGTARRIDTSRPTVVVAGDGAGWEAARFAEEAGLPLLAEPSSGARGGATAIGPYQRIIPELASEVENVVVFGRPTLSRPVTRLLGKAPNVTIVSEEPEWVDVAGRAREVVHAVKGEAGDPAWLELWRVRERDYGAREPGMGGKVLAWALGAGQPQTMIGSSMAIRYADIHAPVGAAFTKEEVWSSRGLAGIDGTIATASGIALASGPTRVIMGDLTFAHDVGALALGPQEQVPPLEIVVLNDHGGAIFAQLEHGEEKYAQIFPRYLATPVSFDIEQIARGYGWDYERVQTVEALEPAARVSEERKIIEVTLPPVVKRKR